jgi:hypothetical protein
MSKYANTEGLGDCVEEVKLFQHPVGATSICFSVHISIKLFLDKRGLGQF